MNNPYRIFNLIAKIRVITDDCTDLYTKSKLQDVLLDDVKADAWDAGFKAGKTEHTTFGYQPLVKVVALPQHVIHAAMVYFPSKKINAIKEVRNITLMDLKDAKDVVDSLFAQEMDKQHANAVSHDLFLDTSSKNKY